MTESLAWAWRPILWFATAYTIVTIGHELVHALTAYALGISSTLRIFSVDVDHAHATVEELAAIGVAGPSVSLIAGGLCWAAHHNVKSTAARLPLLYLAAFGVSTFFGNLMSAAFVGDFSNAAEMLAVPMAVRYALAIMGAAGVAGVLFLVGRELRQWIPARAGRVLGVTGIVALPVVVGTSAVILLNQPAADSFIPARMGEASFWVPAALGAARGTRTDDGNTREGLRLHWADVVLALVGGLAVRILMRGVQFVP